jgi:hypothetical protein
MSRKSFDLERDDLAQRLSTPSASEGIIHRTKLEISLGFYMPDEHSIPSLALGVPNRSAACHRSLRELVA